jgi:hypothetical protein
MRVKIKIPSFVLRYRQWVRTNIRHTDPDVHLSIIPHQVGDYLYWGTPLVRKLGSGWYYVFDTIDNPWKHWISTRPKIWLARVLAFLSIAIAVWVPMILIVYLCS